MEPSVIVDKRILEDIEASVLSDNVKQWQAAVKAAPYRVLTDRQKYATESWKRTVGEDIEIRRAKLLQNILENIEIKIHDFDTIAGRITPTVIGAYTDIDICGDYIEDIWNDDGRIGMTLDAAASISAEELEILRDAARTFRDCTPANMGENAWRHILGDWPKDVEAARIKDPPMNSGNFGNTTNTLNFTKILNKGLRFFINEAKGHMRDFVENMEQKPSRYLFWEAAVICCEAIITLAHRYAEEAKRLASGNVSEKRRAQLLKIADMCMHVPEYPARSFHEALQSMAITGISKALEHPMHNHPQWGRGDQYLYPFFIEDIRSGKMTAAEGVNLIAELVGRWGASMLVDSGTHKQTHQINYGINSINLGGITVDGKEGTNELSYAFLHAVGLLCQSSPTVGIRWNHSTPDWFMTKAIRVNVQTRGGIPLFENEEPIIEHFVKDGIPLDEARNWVGLGCVWPVLPTRSEYKGGAAGINGAAILHMTLHNGVAVTGKTLGLETGDPRDFGTFEELFDALSKQYKYIVHRTLWLANLARDVQWKYLRLPCLSTLSLQFCMDEGQDTMVPHLLSQYGTTDRAIIDVADSLMAIKKLVYDEKRLTMDELMNALDSDFAGERGEEIRAMCLRAPKFGNDIDEVDMMAQRVGKLSAGCVTSWDNSPYQNFKSVREGLSWHYAAGLGVGALPNGRRAFAALNDGSASPQHGCDVNGPTAVLRSILKADFAEHSYVAALNQKFTPSILATDAGVENLKNYTNAFLGAGGTHIQYNIVDTEELKDAKIHPEEHQQLIVRVGGFSAYFVQLSEAIQDDVIMRSQFNGCE